jgi:predicted nucleic acid-binding protein
VTRPGAALYSKHFRSLLRPIHSSPLRRGDQASLERFDALSAQPDLLWVDLTAPVVEQATRLRALHGVRTPDALQAACCLQLGSDALMVSGDADFRGIPTLQLRLLS